jgi:hypothetical protein
MGKDKDLDELWNETAGTPVCPKCDSPLIYGHIREINIDLAVVDWTCEVCGYKWSNCCPFEDGVLTAVDTEDL